MLRPLNCSQMADRKAWYSAEYREDFSPGPQADSKSKPRDLYRWELVRTSMHQNAMQTNITKIIPSEEEPDTLAIRRAIF